MSKINPETIIKKKGLVRLSRIGAFINHPTGSGIPRSAVEALVARCAPYVPFDVWALFNRLPVIKFGYPGSSDTIGVVPIVITPEMVGKTVGVATCVEFKTPTGRQSPKQKRFERHVKTNFGLYALENNANGIEDRVMASIMSMLTGGAE